MNAEAGSNKCNSRKMSVGFGSMATPWFSRGCFGLIEKVTRGRWALRSGTRLGLGDLSCACVYVRLLTHVQLLTTPWTACLWNFSGKHTEVGCHFPPAGDLPNPGIKPMSLESSALAGRVFTSSTTWEGCA